jgi:hypothetical protein
MSVSGIPKYMAQSVALSLAFESNVYADDHLSFPIVHSGLNDEDGSALRAFLRGIVGCCKFLLLELQLSLAH